MKLVCWLVPVEAKSKSCFLHIEGFIYYL